LIDVGIDAQGFLQYKIDRLLHSLAALLRFRKETMNVYAFLNSRSGIWYHHMYLKVLRHGFGHLVKDTDIAIEMNAGEVTNT
jgi:hypothetical protein